MIELGPKDSAFINLCQINIGHGWPFGDDDSKPGDGSSEHHGTKGRMNGPPEGQDVEFTAFKPIGDV